MGTVISGGDLNAADSIFRINQEEALNKNGHQNWYRVVLHDFNDGKQFEAVVHKHETWSEPSEFPEPEFRGVRGQGDIEENRKRAARRAKKKVRHACKSAQFDRMLTLTTRQAIYDRDVFQKMLEKFIRLVRKATGDAMLYVLMRGVPLIVVRDLLGHSSIKVTEIYAHLAPENARDAVGMLVGEADGVTQKWHTDFEKHKLGNTKALFQMVGGTGFEPVTPAV